MTRSTAWHPTTDAPPGAGSPLESVVMRVRAALGGDANAGPSGDVAPAEALVRAFGLAAAERDLLDLALALAVEPDLGQAYAAVQGAPHRRCPTEALTRILFGHPEAPIWRPGSPLAFWSLLMPVARSAGEAEAFEADPRVVDWLRGLLGLDAPLVGRAHLVEPRPEFAAWPVAATAREVARALEGGVAVRVLVAGPEGTGRATFAAAVAAATGRRALAVDPAGAEDMSALVLRARRLTRVSDLALVWRDREGFAPPAHPPPSPLEFVTTGPRGRFTAAHGVADLVVQLPAPAAEERRRLWLALLPVAAAWPPAALGALATRPGTTAGDIVAVARSAPARAEQAAERLRLRTRTRLGDIGRTVTPRLGWNDLVLPPTTREALAEIAFEAEARARLMAEPEAGRLYARGGAVAVLFSGPPGTGKTMAAEVIAEAVGTDLLVVDLAATISKYIGETAKNLSRIFDEATAAGAVLLFDEADALFAKRTEVRDAHDRHANADTNHLLQLLEAFEGLAILATNRRTNMDPAFVRRLRHVVEFARPGAAERRLLWRQAVAAIAGAEAVQSLAAVLDELAELHELTAAQIKSAALTARYGAMREGARLGRDHLLRGLGRELAKDGRAVEAPARPTRNRHG